MAQLSEKHVASTFVTYILFMTTKISVEQSESELVNAQEHKLIIINYMLSKVPRYFVVPQFVQCLIELSVLYPWPMAWGGVITNDHCHGTQKRKTERDVAS